jgi:WD40 repeat protein
MPTAIAPNGRGFAVAHGPTVVLYDAAGKRLLPADGGEEDGRVVRRTSDARNVAVVYGRAWCANLSPDGSLLLLHDHVHEGRSAVLTVRDLRTGRDGWTLTLQKGSASGWGGEWLPVMTPDGRAVIWSETEHIVCDADTGKELRRFGATPPDKRTGSAPGVGIRAVSPDGTLPADAREGTVRLWEIATGKELAVRPAHPAPITAMDFSPDGKRLATGSTDTTVLVWDLARVRRPAP